MKWYKEIEVQQNESEDFTPTHLKVVVEYSKDYNRGVHIDFRKVEKTEENWESVMLFDNYNFSINMLPLARKSAKKIAMVENVVEKHLDKIYALYGACEYGKLKSFISEIADEF